MAITALSILCISILCIATHSMASSVTFPKARPDATDMTVKARAPDKEAHTAIRPISRPDSLFKSVIISKLDEIALIAADNTAAIPKIYSTSSEVIVPVKRPAITIDRKKAAQKSQKITSNLSARDNRNYSRIFEYQKSGQWAKADEIVRQLDSSKLLGHVMFQRYMHPTKYKSSFNELSAWLDEYSDHPNARDIYTLANIRTPQGHSATLVKPKSVRKMRGSLEINLTDRATKQESTKRSTSDNRAVKALNKQIHRHLSKGQPSLAIQRMAQSVATAHLSPTEADNLTARIAASYLYEGKPEKAAFYAKSAWARSTTNAPLAGWVAGLTAWMSEDYIQAASYFSKTASSDYANGWLQSASAYWAARSYKKLRNTTNHQKWLLNAAQHPRTFYGLIALRALGKDAVNQFNWEAPKYTAQHRQILLKIKSTNRALALVKSGQHHLAELEFRQIYPGANPPLREAMLAYALKNGLASFALRFGNTYKSANGDLYDAALYPVGGWEPKNGYQMDKALIHAFIRQESEFNPTAENPSGATGLMQLMPRTASYVAGDKRYGGKLGRYLLKDPKENLEIGQKYIKQLMGQSAVSRDLFSLAIAYNAGPGNLRKWKNRYTDVSDPLLFVELIPLSETRSFVERVMRNLWIYRQRMGQPTPSLDNVASGNWARYVQLDADLPFDVALSE
jgi:soluble lytic murein transglycosylase